MLPRLLLVVLLAAPALALAAVVDDLRESVMGILRAQDLLDRERLAEVSLDKELATLTRVVETPGLHPAPVSIARYWRARGTSLLNWVRMKKAEPPERKLAQAGLSDLEHVIAVGIQVPDWNVSISDALYMAGTIARNHLEEYGRAYAYWERCAALKHAGCLNIMATARLTGEGGIGVDLEQSIELNKTVYDTGTDYRCAGAYSALAIANTIHFAGLTPGTVDAFEWLRRASLLLDELAEKDKLPNPCDRPLFDITEYLQRLSRGEKKPELLRSAARRSGANDFKPLAEYLLGDVTRESFQASIARTPLKHNVCDLHFFALWHADIQGDAALSASHLNSLAAMGGDHCRTQLALIKLKKR
jgi:hypothetical protein